MVGVWISSGTTQSKKGNNRKTVKIVLESVFQCTVGTIYSIPRVSDTSQRLALSIPIYSAQSYHQNSFRSSDLKDNVSAANKKKNTASRTQ